MQRTATAILTILLVWSGASQAVGQTLTDRPWTEARACLDDPDVPICWLKLVGQQMGPNALRIDPELRQRPALLAEVAPPAPPAPAEIEDDEQPAQVKAYLDALTAAFERSRQGATPELFLAPLQSLPVTGAYALANPVQEGIMSFGRLDAYAAMAMLLSERDDAGQSTTSLRTVLGAWERDLDGVDEATLFNEGSSSLATRYNRMGDQAAAIRVLHRLAPENEPALIEGLVEIGRLEEAARISDEADASRGLDRLRRRRVVMERLAADQMAEFAAFQADYIKDSGREDIMADALTQGNSINALLEGDVTDAKIEDFNTAFADVPDEERQALLASVLEDRGEAAAETMPSADDENRLVAEDELQRARARLMAAADRAGRPELVLTTARQAFRQATTPANQNLFGAGDLSQALKLIIGAASRDEAVSALESAEAHAWKRRDGGLQSILPAIHDGWIAVGRPERADALITSWRPIAEAQTAASRQPESLDGVLGDDGQAGAVQGLQNILIAADDFAGATALGWLSPDRALRRDFETGRGVSLLDQRLEALAPQERVSMLISCRYMAVEAQDATSARACAERWADLAETSLHKSGAAEALLAAAQLTAREDATRAFTLARRAVELGSEAEQTATEPIFTSSWQTFSHLQDVAKALLRADGRLPATAEATGAPTP